LESGLGGEVAHLCQVAHLCCVARPLAQWATQAGEGGLREGIGLALGLVYFSITFKGKDVGPGLCCCVGVG
jgi:hypothetical protein